MLIHNTKEKKGTSLTEKYLFYEQFRIIDRIVADRINS